METQAGDNTQPPRTALPRYAVKQTSSSAARKCCRRMFLFNRASAGFRVLGALA